jgi:hypothetical protein
LPQNTDIVIYNLIQAKLITKLDAEEYYTLDEIIMLFTMNFIGEDMKATELEKLQRGGKQP